MLANLLVIPRYIKYVVAYFAFPFVRALLCFFPPHSGYVFGIKVVFEFLLCSPFDRIDSYWS